MTLTFEVDLDNVNMNQLAKYLYVTGHTVKTLSSGHIDRHAPERFL